MKRLMAFFLFCALCGQIPSFAVESHKVARLPYNDTNSVLNFVRHYLPANPVIVEAGGCDGNDSKHMAKFWPKGHVYTFEAVPELFEKIKVRAQHNKNIHPYLKALSDKDGHATFYLSVDNSAPDRISVSSSLLPPKEHLTGAPFVTFPYAIEVETVSLDSWAKQEGVNHVDFLWLDMQGYELNMVMASELAKNARAIWTEVEFIEAYAGQYQFNDVLAWMEANGFYLAATNFNLNAQKTGLRMHCLSK